MAGKNYLYADLKKPEKKMSNITFKEEISYKAFTNQAEGRTLYVSIDEIVELSPEAAEKIMKKLQGTPAQ